MAGSPLKRARKLAAEAAARGEVYIPPPELAERARQPIAVKSEKRGHEPVDRAEVNRRFAEGQAKSQIAREMGIGYQSVNMAIARPDRTPPTPPEPKPKARQQITNDIISDIVPQPGQRIRNVVLSEEDEQKSIAVRMMVSTKTEVTAMADMMGMTADAFRRKYKKELFRGHDYVYAVISQKLVGSAFGGDMRAMIAWLKQFGGWQEVTRKEITGRDGAPISIRSLDGASLVAILEAIGEKGSSRGNRSRARAPQIDVDASYTDLDTVSGTADESTEE